VFNWYKSAFETRQFGDQGAIIICLTRWHQDDLAGRLMKLAAEHTGVTKQWRIVSFPAIAKEERDSRDPREVGEPLWPTKYPLRELAHRKALLGTYDWSSLYQQEPTPSGGGKFKREWFTKYVDAVPAGAVMARGWDTASTEDGGDWTVGVKIAHRDGFFYIVHVERQQLGPHGVDSLIRATSESDGVACAQREEKEGGSAGAAVIAYRSLGMAGKNYLSVPVTGSKWIRATPFAAQCEAGNVFLVRAAWNSAYLDELCDFGPGCLHDDQVDASSCAFNAVLLEVKGDPRISFSELIP
jgi:predicted phage terminase large subunit-like protein